MEGLKFSTIFLFLSIGFANAELTCPEYNNEEETYLPSDTNCNEYFHCVHGVPVMRKCPEGLQWDQAKNICNWPDQISPPCTADCPAQGWIRRDRVSNCYLFGEEEMNYSEAQEFCEDNGGKLAEPRRLRESNVINRMIKNDYLIYNYWIGLTKWRRGSFRWQSDNSEVRYSNWNKGEPDNELGNEDCAVLRKKSFSYKWSDINCYGQNLLGTINTALCQKF